MNELSFMEKMIDTKILRVDTAYIGKVLNISGKNARIQPLSMRKSVGAKAEKQNPVTAFIPPNIKYTTQTISTENGSYTALAPDELAVGDLVYVGVCDRDITYAKSGKIAEATNRHHNINDGVILRVLG